MSPGVGRRDARPLGLARAVGAGYLALALLAGAGCTGVSKDFDAAIQERIRNATYHTETVTDLVEEKIGIDENYHERLLAFGFEEQEVIGSDEQLLERYGAESYKIYQKYYRRRIVSYWSVTVFVFQKDGEYADVWSYIFLSSL